MKFIRKQNEEPWESLALNYLIERAERLNEQTQFNDSDFDDGWKTKKQDLSRLLEIIRAAGVEVAE